jgi:heat shock protein HtpX
MVAVSLATPLAVVVMVAAVVLFVPWPVILYLTPFLLFGLAATVGAYLSRPYPRSSQRREAPEVHALVERVCAMADLRKPRIVLVPSPQPNSWVVAQPRYPPRLFLTAGLLELLDVDELEAVVAHELAHLAHRDAVVMTIVGGPGAIFAGSVLLVRKKELSAVLGVLIALPVGAVTRVATAALSRYRELAADASAVAITGKPMALASALRKVSGTLQAIPSRDLRALAVHDEFNLVAAGTSRYAWLSTHPDIEDRVARLEAMERGLHARVGARP